MSTRVEAPDIGKRPPVCYLNYPRDVVAAIGAMIDEGDAVFGPSTMGEALWPVEAVYDPDEKRTRVGLTYIPPAPVVTP